jgi:DNA modification methylase
MNEIAMPYGTVLIGDAIERLSELPDDSVGCCITSPPYFGLRDYGMPGQIGLEPTPDEYVARMVGVFAAVRRVLADDGTLWLNLGDSYAAARGGTHPPAETLAGGRGGYTEDGGRVNRSRHDGYNPTRNATAIGLKHKDLIGIPWRVALALQAAGWYLRSDIIWHKPNPMPESVTDRPTCSYEHVFLLAKSAAYYYDAEAIAEPSTGRGSDFCQTYDEARISRGRARTDAYEPKDTRNRRDVWTVATQPTKEAHFATYPPELIRPCVRAGCPIGGTVLDPFMGSGTTGIVAVQEGRRFLGIELNAEYAELSRQRIMGAQPPLMAAC